MTPTDERIKELNETVIKLAKGLKDYRHDIINGTAANWKSLRQIENRTTYMSEATDIFNKVLEDVRELTEDKADED